MATTYEISAKDPTCDLCEQPCVENSWYSHYDNCPVYSDWLADITEKAKSNTTTTELDGGFNSLPECDQPSWKADETAWTPVQKYDLTSEGLRPRKVHDRATEIEIREIIGLEKNEANEVFGQAVMNDKTRLNGLRTTPFYYL